MILRKIRALLRSQDGFTMMLALSVMLVTSLLLVAGYTATNGDIQTSHRDTLQKQAYYAALAGIQQFEYQMQANPNYWEGCPTPSSVASEELGARYEDEILYASSAPAGTTKCVSGNPFKTAIESTGTQANTFRVLSVGCAGPKTIAKCPVKGASESKVVTRSIVATFQVIGFLNFVYFTNHEIEDPALYEGPAICSNTHAYYPETEKCNIIQFATGDAVKGPMHTNDAVCVGGSASFGREGHTPKDIVEFFRGLNKSCGGTGKYNTSTGKYAKGESMEPPESDSSLETYALEENEFTGVTRLVLNGTTNTISVTNNGSTTTLAWPSNGLIWIKGSKESGCGYKYEPHETDDKYEETHETECGNVYVSGTYSKSLTVGSSDDVIVNGNLTPTGVTLGSESTGTAVLGLIANNYVRVYHPVGETYSKTAGSKCKENTYSGHSVKDKEVNSTTCEYTNEALHFGSEEVAACDAPNAAGSQTSPWIYAAILSTLHSFIVDNFNCGEKLENLNVMGVIAQNYRGIVGTSGGTGYIKNYNYDQRLAVDEPPYFLAPLKAGWKVARETSPTAG
jgi:Tfp pilus assembly protein PilE